ncbi:MAG: R3H domain-containing nucleic acid-binding protein [Candidatus Campbellbacteria bacterium]|nr:R3H domain-containing nucleic acid-binding protein [Candidatus Campbellbacteria bacterium]
MKKDIPVSTLLEEILTRMLVSFERIDEVDDSIGINRFNIISKDDSPLLIGPRGDNLQALNTLLKHIKENHEGSEDLSFIIDVNDYQKELLEGLRNQTKIIAERVKLFKKELPLSSMSAYERMIVHAVAKTIEGIKTRSEGQGRKRYVVIEPAD